MWKQVLFFIVCLLYANYSLVMSSTIRSAPAGGNWGDKSTWIGNIVPTANDDVIISSTIYCPGQSYSTKTYGMQNLTIEANGKIIRLENSSGLSSLAIDGNLINYGEIVDYDSYFDINVTGNIQNYNVLSPRYIYWTGDNVTLITEGYIECNAFYINTSNPAIAISDIKFKNTIVASSSSPRQNLNLNGYDLYLLGDEPTYDGYYNKINTKNEFRNDIVTTHSNIYIEKSAFSGTVAGDLTLHSSSYGVLDQIDMTGNLTIADNSIISARSYLVNLNILEIRNRIETFEIPFNDVSHGAYIVEIIINGKTKSIRVIK